MKEAIARLRPVFVVTTLGLTLGLTLANCAGDAQFQSDSGKRLQSRVGSDAIVTPPKTSSVDDGGQKPQIAAKKAQENAVPITTIDGIEVESPLGPLSGSEAILSNGIEVPTSNLPNPQSIRVEFPASTKLSGSLIYDTQEKSFSTTVVLKNQYSNENVTFTQIQRPTITDSFKQGNPGIPKIDTFNQKQLGVVDIQVVIDNSRSMDLEQQKVKSKLPDLLKYIGESNWQINVATTDPRFFSASGLPTTNGGKRKCSQEGVMKKGEADALARFSKAISAGIDGSGNEKGIMMAVEGLRCPQANNWVRPGSKVVVLIVSDEDNCSKFGNTVKDGGCPGAPEEVHTYLTNYLATTIGRPLITHSRVYGIYKKPGDATCKTAENEAVTYQKAVLATRDPANPGTGYEGSICDEEMGYTNTFQSISKDIATLLDTSFPLATTPDPASLTMTVDTVTIPRLNGSGEANWELDPVTKRLIKFVKYTPPAGSEIKIAYVVGATTPLVKNFKLSKTPTNDPTADFIVYVNGATAKLNTDYVFDAPSNSIKFILEPAADASVKVVYKEAMNLSTQFKLTKPIAEGFAATVTVNGKIESSFTYDKSSRDIIFVTAPADGATIGVAYNSLTGPITVYDINLVGATIKNATITYVKNNSPVNGAKIEKNTLVVSELGFLAGETILIKYFNETSGTISLKLPKLALPDSLMVTASEGSCNYLLTPGRDEVTLECSALGAKKVTINWSYFTEAQTIYTIPRITRPEFGTWTVEIDRKQTTDFKREGQTIILNAPPLQTSVITVTYVEST